MMSRFPAGVSQRRSACLLFTARSIIGTRALASSLKPNFNPEGKVFVLVKGSNDQLFFCTFKDLPLCLKRRFEVQLISFKITIAQNIGKVCQ